MLNRRHFLNLIGAAGLLAASPVHASGMQSFGGRAFGSYWRLVLAQPGDELLIRARITEIIASVNAAMSPYDPTSELSRFNRSQSTDWQPLTLPTWRVLDAALRSARQTGNAFDPTVGPIVGRYGFGPIAPGPGGRLADIELEQNRLRKSDTALTLDLCGIAKGYALDMMTQTLQNIGLDDFVIELGGEVAARGRHPDGRNWRIAVDAADGQTPPMALDLNNKVVATSGHQPQGFWHGAKHYSHIIDATMGEPASGGIASVSVVADTGMQADALATALCSMTAEQAIPLAERLGADAVFSLRDGTATQQILTGRIADLRLF